MPLRDQEARAGRPGCFVMMHVSRHDFIDGQRQGRVPQRTGPQQLSAVIADLPVQSGKRIGEAGIGGRARHDETAFRVNVDAREQLPEMNVEVAGDRARDMALEQDGQCDTRDA